MCRRSLIFANLLFAIFLQQRACLSQVKARLAPELDADFSDLYQDANRLLVYVSEDSKDGLRVTSALAGSPALKMSREDDRSQSGRLEPGDLITQIDGTVVPSLKSYYDALDSSKGDLKLTVIDKNTSQTINWLVTPAKVKVPVVPYVDSPPDDRIAHVLLIGLSHDDTGGNAFGGNVEIMKEIIQTGISPQRLDLETILGDDCRAATIIRKVREVGAKSRPQDAIFVYYAGHGAYDPGYDSYDPTGGHYFQIPPEASAPPDSGGDLLRKTLFDNMLAQPGRLKILISDSCNVKAVAHPYEVPKMKSRDTAVSGPTDLEQLLLYHQGYLDMDAASRDQYCWLNTAEHGYGWFTLQFAGLFPHENSWPALLDKAARKSNEYFLDEKQKILAHPKDISSEILAALTNQNAQIPAVFRARMNKDDVPKNGSRRVVRQTTVALAPANSK